MAPMGQYRKVETMAQQNTIDGLLGEIKALAAKREETLKNLSTKLAEIDERVDAKRNLVHDMLVEAGVIEVPKPAPTKKSNGGGPKAQRDPERGAKVVAYITEKGKVSTAEVYSEFKLNIATANYVLTSLVEAGKIVRLSKGLYAPAPAATPPAPPADATPPAPTA